MGVLPPIRCIEGKPISVESRFHVPLQRELARLRNELRPRLPFWREDEDGMRIQNLVGTVDVGRGQSLEIAPKTDPGDNWVASVLALMIGTERIDVAGERAAGLTHERPNLIESFAAIYAARLDRALRRDGPLMVMNRQRIRSGSLSGRLDVTQWSRRVLTDLTSFPVEVSRLTADNAFSQTLAYVAIRLANASRRPVTRIRLRNAASLLRPGLATDIGSPGGAWRSRLPPQWSAYGPAWSVAGALLGHRSLLGPEGPHSGVSIAIEPWPLLETLLVRSLGAACATAQASGRNLAALGSPLQRMLHVAGGTAVRPHDFEPDAMLVENETTIATFEAKYRDYDPLKGPKRHEIYQAVAAARATGAATAVLVYPGDFAPGHWTLPPGGGCPLRLAAVGLRMFSYRAGGEAERGQLLLGAIT